MIIGRISLSSQSKFKVVRTSDIVTCIPFAKPLYRLPNLKHNDPPAQRNRKPPASTGQSSDLLPELEFRDLLGDRIVP